MASYIIYLKVQPVSGGNNILNVRGTRIDKNKDGLIVSTVDGIEHLVPWDNIALVRKDP